MKIEHLKWVGNERKDGGTDVWTLHGNVSDGNLGYARRKLFDIAYLGRTHVAFGGGHMRWQVYDRRYWVDEYLEQIPEFPDVEEAKAWVDTVVRLS
jgi:hypothetical protein